MAPWGAEAGKPLGDRRGVCEPGPVLHPDARSRSRHDRANPQGGAEAFAGARRQRGGWEAGVIGVCVGAGVGVACVIVCE